MPATSRRAQSAIATLLASALLTGCSGADQYPRAYTTATAGPACGDACRREPSAPPLKPPVIRGPLLIGADGDVAGSFALSASGVDLVGLDGIMRWHVPVSASESARLVAEGDFTGDGVPDAILRVATREPSKTCGGQPLTVTQLVLVDGASGRSWTPLPALEDICWSGFGSSPPYATRQWGTGTAYVGDFGGVSGAVITFPYYATAGTVMRFTGDGFAAVAGAAVGDLVYPSTARYDLVYNRTNPTRCSVPYPPGPCFIPYAHVPNAVLAGSDLFVLTSARAFLYRPDFGPTSDLTWISGGRLDNGGRNYGLVTTMSDASIALIGGCSVLNTAQEMRAGGISNFDCSVHHHYEWFSVASGQIQAHASRYYGYVTTDGPLENRIEYPLHAASAITGRRNAIFDLYRKGSWAIELLENPAQPDAVYELPGWYAWDALPLGADGSWAVLASRVGAATASSPALPDWSFDVLAWRNGQLSSEGHFEGLVPALLQYPNSPGLHASDSLPAGVLTVPHLQAVALLVEDRAGHRSYVDLPALPAGPGNQPAY